GLGNSPGAATVAVDVPLEALRKMTGVDSTRALMRWQVRIRGRDGSWPVSSDSVFAVALPQVGNDRDRYLTLVREFALPPGEYDLRLVLSDRAGATGAMYARDGMAIVDGAEPNISDLVLIPDGGQGASRLVENEALHLSSTFTAGSARFVRVGYLLTGLGERDARVTVRVTPAGDRESEKSVVAVEFTD